VARLRRIASYCILCTLSFVAGGVAVAYMSVRASRAYTEIARLDYRTAEERAAVCARIAGKPHEALWHYHNVVAAEIESAVGRTANIWTMTFPLDALWLELIRKSETGDPAHADRIAVVRGLQEGQYRARFGMALEESNQEEEANDQYEQAAHLMRRDAGEVRARAREYWESEAKKGCSR
jgi:hypothetical protein